MRMKIHTVLYFMLSALLANSQETSTQQLITVPEDANATFTCTVSNVATTTWTFLKKGQGTGGAIIAQGSNAYKAKDHNVMTSLGNSPFFITLIVLEADEDDEGMYSCQDAGKEKTMGELTVEIPPDVQLKRDGVKVNDTIDVEYTKEIPIQCVAERGKPLVSLTWFVNGRDKTDGVTTNLSRADERIITSTLNYLPNLDDTTVTCITSGQEKIQSISVNTSVNVLYAPSCNLLVTNETSNQFRLLCSCDANPAASNYTILVNGSIYRNEKDALLPSNDTTIVSCSASNVIGTDVTDEQTLKPFYVAQPPSSGSSTRVALIVAIPASIIVLVVVSLLIFYWRKAKKKETQGKYTNTSLHAAINMDQPPEVDKKKEKEKTPPTDASEHKSTDKPPSVKNDDEDQKDDQQKKPVMSDTKNKSTDKPSVKNDDQENTPLMDASKQKSSAKPSSAKNDDQVTEQKKPLMGDSKNKSTDKPPSVKNDDKDQKDDQQKKPLMGDTKKKEFPVYDNVDNRRTLAAVDIPLPPEEDDESQNDNQETLPMVEVVEE